MTHEFPVGIRTGACALSLAVTLAALVALARPAAAADPSPPAAEVPAPAAPPAAPTDPSPITDAGSPVADPAPAPVLTVSHFLVAPITQAGVEPRYFPLDAGIADLGRLVTVRVRFQVRNTGTADTVLGADLEYGQGGTFTPVPFQDDPGAAFLATTEWVPAAGGGTVEGSTSTAIAAPDLQMPAEGATPVPGVRSMGVNPAPELDLPAGGVTEVEFSIRVSAGAGHGQSYELRIRQAGSPLPGPTVGLTLAPAPAPDPGVDVVAVPAKAMAAPLAAADLSAPSPHGQAAALTTDTCAACHRTHTATGPALTRTAGAGSGLCLLCHDGTGANSDIAGAYAGYPDNQLTAPVLAANGTVLTPGSRATYQHSAGAPTSAEPGVHTLASNNEFAGVSNRHSQCTDCHDPHDSAATRPAPATTGVVGWSAPGTVAGAPGVAVTNGAAGTAPTYTFLDGQTTRIAAEYQLCFTCHSGFTRLPTNVGFPLSQYSLDKGIEFNPANPSFHPIEAPGRNRTTKMADSLAGTSPYKRWTFTIDSTIRCLNCHADPASLTAGALPESSLPGHGSANRGLLLAPYEDRTLNTRGTAYQAGKYQLCFLCHTDAPFRSGGDTNATATNFDLHGKHMAGIGSSGSTAQGYNIDTPGAGAGNSLCAECHYRLHSTTFAPGSQSLAAQGLVSFAPNVTGVGAAPPTFVVTAGGGSCTLTCHGKDHSGKTYRNR